jgi:hypothetical protein
MAAAFTGEAGTGMMNMAEDNIQGLFRRAGEVAMPA